MVTQNPAIVVCPLIQQNLLSKKCTFRALVILQPNLEYDYHPVIFFDEIGRHQHLQFFLLHPYTVSKMLRTSYTKNYSTSVIVKTYTIVVTAILLFISLRGLLLGGRSSGAVLLVRPALLDRPSSPVERSLYNSTDERIRRKVQVERMYGLHAEQPWLSYISTLGTEVHPSPPLH